MNRLISVYVFRVVAIKHLVKLSVEYDFFLPFVSKRKSCHGFAYSHKCNLFLILNNTVPLIVLCSFIIPVYLSCVESVQV